MSEHKFDDWTQKLWLVTSHRSAPNFFESGRELRFVEKGGKRHVVSTPLTEGYEGGDAGEQKDVAFASDVDELTVEFSSSPLEICIISRFVKSNTTSREILVGRVLRASDRGEVGSWTAVDGSGGGSGTGGGEG